ncbi:Crp/Fnr family transcriptional regulator [Pelagibacterium limicola]|uniref:Crp/Fnr family transcriptional regulator n=1 Tax=Pelagibacterium limicola TaxID=2791022 RepID=UPI0018AF93F2|nr:Crp/Fnr family transcriptional regulator [Pelagibacterium limicola]
MSIQQESIRNGILAGIPSADFECLRGFLEPVTLKKGFQIAREDERIEWVYFPEAGIGSVVAVSPEGKSVEAGLFGREGFSPTAALIGTEISTHRIIAQAPGGAHRMAITKFRDCIVRFPSMRDLLERYMHNMSTQMSYTALSNAVHVIDERLARWLLMCHDRSDSDEMALTHEFLALMLAVRRPSVTTALHVLEGKGFIRAERGYVTIRNRAALEEFAADAYGKPEEEYRRLIGNGV